jgi:hypothetical protein
MNYDLNQKYIYSLTALKYPFYYNIFFKGVSFLFAEYWWNNGGRPVKMASGFGPEGGALPRSLRSRFVCGERRGALARKG